MEGRLGYGGTSACTESCLAWRSSGCSINVGRSNTLVPMVWADFDTATFNAVSKSMVKFAHTCYSKCGIVFDVCSPDILY